MSYRTLNALRALALGCTLIATPALASIQSSCPAPCAKPPKTALFMREAAVLNGFSGTNHLIGTLSRGSAHTVVRVDATIALLGRGSITGLSLGAEINNVPAAFEYQAVAGACADTHQYCTVTGTFWFDMDELETANPGTFVGQPLNIDLSAFPLVGLAVGSPYRLSFSAQVVKKK